MTLSFRLDDAFIATYVGTQPKWGPIGYVTYKRTYARELVHDYDRHAELGIRHGLIGSEEFWLTVTRVVEGTFSILQDHCKSLRLSWDEARGQRQAQEMFALIWNFKFLPPGRGLWMMGTPVGAKIGGVVYNNCGFFSSAEIATDFSRPFCDLMDFSMLGVGIGGDVRGSGTVTFLEPVIGDTQIVADTREGWVDLLRRVLDSYVGIGTMPSSINYSLIRPAGTPIKGFGGTASGSAPLEELIASVRSLLDGRAGETITSADIVDIFNFVGRCVVSGNLRRCLPEDALVHTLGGLVPIKDVRVGDDVVTSQGYRKVTEVIRQGRQQLITIQTQMGEFRCTPNHRVAVMTAPGIHDFKMAGDLVAGDRLVFLDECIEGTHTEMPSWNYEKPAHSTTCKDITIPELDASMAWFLGMLAGDGYVRANRKDGGFNACVSLPVNADEYHDEISTRILDSYTRFGIKAYIIEPSEKDNCRRYNAISKQFAWYLDDNFKKPKVPLRVPACVMRGTQNIRAAYVAGLLDADGSVKTRPMLLACSVYPNYLREIQSIYASLGIPTRLWLHREARGEWQALYHLTLVGEGARASYRSRVQPYAVKKITEENQRSGHDYGYPSKWVSELGRGIKVAGKWSRDAAQMTTSTYTRCGGTVGNKIPVTVLSVEQGLVENTYDLSIEGVHEFVANGLLVHNSAEIVLGEPTDELFLELKDREKHGAKVDSHRWASNNSIFATVGQSYTKVAKQTAKNGEPGYFWLENARRYGRMIDPVDNADEEALGCNPCVTADTVVMTSEGLRRVDELIGKPFMAVVNGQVFPCRTGFFSTGVKPVFDLTLSSGHRLKLTANHEVLTTTGWVPAGALSDEAVVLNALDNNRRAGTPAFVSLLACGEEQVYDCTVDDIHAFSANGIVVHNCAEQTLHDSEICCLVESFPFYHRGTKEFLRTLKFAYLYAKAVTLVPTHNARTNAVTMKNRRIGCSMSGIVQAMTKFGRRGFLDMCDESYAYILRLDKQYSGWLCVPKSIKHTSVKPSGSVSLLPQATPGIHHPYSEYYWRVIRFATDSHMLPALRAAGYECVTIDPAKEPNTTAVYFPVKEEGFERGAGDITMWEQLELAAALQAHWADNQVSATISFDKKTEGPQIGRALELYETRLKGVSFLPRGDHGYEHAPYQPITREEYEAAAAGIGTLDLSRSSNEVQDKFCDGDKCTIPVK